MPPRLTVQIHRLADLLGPNHRLQVPSFQRPYAWKAEAGQLLDDILMSLSEDAERPGEAEGHFIGTMLLMPGTDGSDGRTDPTLFDIVDGQQRLLTVTILLAVLRDLAADRGLALGPDIERMLFCGVGADGRRMPRLVLRGSDQQFLHELVLAPGASAVMPDDDMVESQRLILDAREHFLAELADKTDAEIQELARYLAAECSAVVIATSGVDRAHRLFEVLNNRGRPLARTDILKAHILGLIPSDQRAGYTARWHTIEARLGPRFDDLFSHLRAIDGRSRERIVEGIEDAVSAAGGAHHYFDEQIVPFAEILAAIREAKGPTAGASRSLAYLGWLGSADWVAPAMLYWRRTAGDPARLEQFLARLERLAFCLRLLGIGADKRQTRFNQLLAAVRAGRLDGPENPLELSREDSRNILYNLRSLHARSQLTCKLLLLRVNDELAGAPQGLDPQAYTVEHVLPQRPPRGSQWRKWFPSAEERETATQSLGNLVLVTREQNDRARNLELARKLEAYFAPGTGTVPFITAELAAKVAWTPADVTEREERILAAVDRLWRLEAGRVGLDVPRPAGDGGLLRDSRPPIAG